MTITEMRKAYQQLRDRAAAANPELSDYVHELWAIWDGQLARMPDDAPGDSTFARLLTDLIGRPELTAEELLTWLDAYPWRFAPAPLPSDIRPTGHARPARTNGQTSDKRLTD